MFNISKFIKTNLIWCINETMALLNLKASIYLYHIRFLSKNKHLKVKFEYKKIKEKKLTQFVPRRKEGKKKQRYITNQRRKKSWFDRAKSVLSLRLWAVRLAPSTLEFWP